MLRDAWSNDGGKGWWRWWSRLGGLLAMATAISCLVAPFPGASANSEAKRLYDDLLSNYNRLIRPVGNNSDRLTVKMGLRLSQLIDVVSRPTLLCYILSIIIIIPSLSFLFLLFLPFLPPIERIVNRRNDGEYSVLFTRRDSSVDDGDTRSDRS